MPNRSELPAPAMRSKSAAATSNDAWAIGFCAVGGLMSIYVALASVGLDAAPRLIAQFPWG